MKLKMRREAEEPTDKYFSRSDKKLIFNSYVNLVVELINEKKIRRGNLVPVVKRISRRKNNFS